MNLNILLTNPELAKNIRFEITGSNLFELATALMKVVKEESAPKERFLTREEVKAMVKRSEPTLSRWSSKGILRANTLGMYKESDVLELMNKR